MENKILDRAIVFFGIGILLVLAYLTLRSLVFPIVLAFIIGYAFKPAYESIQKRIKFKGLSALIIIILLMAMVIIPSLFLFQPLMKQTFDLYNKIQGLNLGESIQSLFPSGISPEIVSVINVQFNNILSKSFSSVVNSLSAFITDVPMKLLSLTIFLFIFYFVLVDFDQIGKSFYDFMPFSKESKTKFSAEFKNVTDGVLYGQVLIGILQGVLVGLMLFILGIEGTLLFTIIAIIAGILPLIGPAVIWVPVGIFLIVAGSPIKAIVLAIYCIVVSWATDGFIRPYILSKRTVLSISWGFLSTLGGLFAFGLVGLVIGPLIISYLIIILQFYKQGKFGDLFKA